ncbi:MAG: ferredoxin--NADP reductase [Cytophagales bacterium]|nr:ferredoxin--NADP reductase [Bernardetiaceae bacterium]MDW8210777.1 ferredoxin--NADP reductase [Cytophagales bacterium]
MKQFNLKVKDITRETEDTVTLHLRQPLFSKIKYKPGQFLTLILNINGKSVRRAYSLSSAPEIDDTLSITIKRVPGGLVSNYVNDHVKVGDYVDILEPIGNFYLEPNKDLQRHIVLFGSGSGITPLMSIAKSVLAFEPKSIVSLIYGNRTLETVIFRQKLEEMQNRYGDRFRVVHVLSRAESSQWNGYKGRIDKQLTIDILQCLPKFEADKTEYFMCGPEGMMDQVMEALHALNVPAQRIHRESFFAPTAEETKDEAALKASGIIEQQVTIILDGDEYQITVKPTQSILDAALNAGLDMPYSCQSGLCTACRGLKKSGEVKMDEDEGLSEKEIQQGYILTCVAHPLTENVVIEIG